MTIADSTSGVGNGPAGHPTVAREVARIRDVAIVRKGVGHHQNLLDVKVAAGKGVNRDDDESYHLWIAMALSD